MLNSSRNPRKSVMIWHAIMSEIIKRQEEVCKQKKKQTKEISNPKQASCTNPPKPYEIIRLIFSLQNLIMFHLNFRNFYIIHKHYLNEYLKEIIEDNKYIFYWPKLQKNNVYFYLQTLFLNYMKRQLPFSGIKPLKYIGLNQNTPFCSIASEGKILYTTGANVIMENTRTNEQRILYNNIHGGQIEIIRHHITLYNQHILTIALFDRNTSTRILFIIPLNSILFAEQQKGRAALKHTLRNFEDSEHISGIQCLDEGNYFGLIAKQQNSSFFCLIRGNSGQIVYEQSFSNSQLQVRKAILGKRSCVTLLYKDSFGNNKLKLLILDDLSRNFYYLIPLDKSQRVLDYYFQIYEEECILLILSNTGYLHIFRINQFELISVSRVDVRMNKDGVLVEPLCMHPASNKIVFAYQQSCNLGLLFYSHFNPQNTRFSILKQPLAAINGARRIISIHIAKDNCSLAALVEIHQKNEIHKEQDEFSEALHSSSEKIQQFQEIFQDQIMVKNQISRWIAVQIDLLSNMIKHQQQPYSTMQTFSSCVGRGLILHTQYCSYSNTIFLVTNNGILQYFDLSPRQSKLPGRVGFYQDFKLQGLLLWQRLIGYRVRSIAIHPFNYTILIINDQLVKFHYYNSKCLFPAFLTTSIKGCNIAKYSPLGDKIVLTCEAGLMILHGYTFEVIRVISLPLTPFIQPSCSKLVTALQFLQNSDIMVFSGTNTFTLLKNYQKTLHFGSLDNTKYGKFVVDNTNNLVLMLKQQQVVVLSKANINSKSRCQLVTRIPISATSAFLIPALNILFLGSRQGILYMLNWPAFSQEDLIQGVHKYKQFQQPIVEIRASANLAYLYTVALNGSFCISQLQVNSENDVLSPDIKRVLLHANELPLRQNFRWLISRGQQERKQRQIIKLRGQEVQRLSLNSQIIITQEKKEHQNIINMKARYETNYIKQLKQYEDYLGLQLQLQSMTLLKDEIRIFDRVKQRKIDQLQEQLQKNLKQIFQERNKLQLKYQQKLQMNKNQLAFLKQQYETKSKQSDEQLKLIQQKGQKGAKQANEQENKKQKDTYEQIVNLVEDYFEDLQLLKSEHKQELGQILQANQRILSKNRNRNMEIHGIEDKIGQLGAQREKLQFDIYKLAQQQRIYSKIRQKLIAEDELHRDKYDHLLETAKNLEEKVLAERREHQRYEHSIYELEEELAHFTALLNTLQGKRAKIAEQFMDCRQLNAAQSAQIDGLALKVQELKKIRRVRHYDSCLTKSHFQQALKDLIRQLSVDETAAIKKIYNIYRSRNASQERKSAGCGKLEDLRNDHEKLAQDALKWKDVKESYMSSFHRSHRKLQQENMRLTYRYNDLLRLSQQYRVQMSSIQQQIEKYRKLSRYRKDTIRTPQIEFSHAQNKSKCRFLQGLQKNNKNGSKLKKKLICLSLHQDSGNFITQA